MDIAKFNRRFKTDESKEIKGIEVEIGEGFFVTIARAGNSNAQRRMRELLSDPEVHAKQMANVMDDATWDRIMLDVQSNCILIGWRGLTDGDKEIPFSPEKAAELLQIKDFREKVLQVAGTQEYYRVTSINGAAESLGKP